MPFAKIIDPVKEIGTKGEFPRFFFDLKIDIFPLEYMQSQDLVVFMYSKGKYIKLQNKKKIVKTFIKNCLKHINGKRTRNSTF